MPDFAVDPVAADLSLTSASPRSWACALRRIIELVSCAGEGRVPF